MTAENTVTTAAVMLGGDLGDSEKIFAEACRRLESGGFKILKRSRIFRSAAVDCVPGTPDFCDQALLGEWSKSALELLRLLQSTERAAGRPEQHSSHKARTLDCDLVIFGDVVSDLPKLILPHPRAKSRRFVLEPLNEIAPNLRFPDDGMSVNEAWKKLQELE